MGTIDQQAETLEQVFACHCDGCELDGDIKGFPLNIFEHGSDAVNMMNGGFHLLAQFPCHLETQYRIELG